MHICIQFPSLNLSLFGISRNLIEAALTIRKNTKKLICKDGNLGGLSDLTSLEHDNFMNSGKWGNLKVCSKRTVI